MSYIEDEAILGLLPNAIFNHKGWFRAHCPFCPTVTGINDKRRSLGVHTSGKYHCFRCYTRGMLDEIPDWAGLGFGAQIAGIDLDKEIDFVDEVGCYEPLWREPGISSIFLEEARDYLKHDRRLDEWIWKYARIGASYEGKYDNRIVVPVFKDDEWAGFVTRWWEKKPPPGVLPHLNPPGMSRDMFYDEEILDEETDDPVLVVEAVLDALPYAGHAVACFGKPTHWQRQRLCQVRSRPVAVCLDGDAWEIGEGLALTLQLEGVRSGFVRLPPGEDPDSVERSWLREEARRCIG